MCRIPPTPRRRLTANSPALHGNDPAHARILSSRTSVACIAGQEEAWHITNNMESQMTRDVLIEQRLSLQPDRQKDDGNLFTDQQKQARIQRHLEREALLQSLDM